MSLIRLTNKGQLTLPKPIRDYLELHTGDRVEFIIDENGKVILSSETIDIQEIFGIVKSQKTASIEEMNKSISEKMQRKQKSDRY